MPTLLHSPAARNLWSSIRDTLTYRKRLTMNPLLHIPLMHRNRKRQSFHLLRKKWLFQLPLHPCRVKDNLVKSGACPKTAIFLPRSLLWRTQQPFPLQQAKSRYNRPFTGGPRPLSELGAPSSESELRTFLKVRIMQKLDLCKAYIQLHSLLCIPPLFSSVLHVFKQGLLSVEVPCCYCILLNHSSSTRVLQLASDFSCSSTTSGSLL